MTIVEHVLTSAQVAEQLGASLASVQRWAEQGHLRCIRTPGGHRRFRQVDVDEFVRTRQDEGSAA